MELKGIRKKNVTVVQTNCSLDTFNHSASDRLFMSELRTAEPSSQAQRTLLAFPLTNSLHP